MKHFAVATPGGYVVAYRSPRGYLVAVSDHVTRDSAQRAADGINAAAAARQAQAEATRYRQHAYTERRPVRWFEPDAFA